MSSSYAPSANGWKRVIRTHSIIVGWLALAIGPWAHGADAGPKIFDIAAGLAENSLKTFSVQSGLEVVFGGPTVGKTKTNAVKGRYRAREALELMLAKTGLLAEQDEKTGALMVARDPKGQRAAQTVTEDYTDDAKKKNLGSNDSNLTPNNQMTPSQRPAFMRVIKRFAAFVAASVAVSAQTDDRKVETTRQEAVELSPFVVDTTKDRGYLSKNTVSGAGFDTTLMKLPQTIEIMNREMMQDLNAQSMIESMQFVSAGIARNGYNNGDDLYMWGFRQVGGLKDGVPFVSNAAGTLYDVDRVEAIKGPSAMLYGQAASFGGLINYVTRKPTRVPHLSMQAQFGSYSEGGAQLHASGPITDRLRYRVDLGALSKRDARKYGFYRDRFIGGGFEYDFSDTARLLTNVSYSTVNYFKPQTIFDPAQALSVTVPPGANPAVFKVNAIPLQGVPDDHTINEPWHQYYISQWRATATLTTQLGEKLTSRSFVAYSNDANDWLRDQVGGFRPAIGAPDFPAITLANHTMSKIAVAFKVSQHNLNIQQVFLKELKTGPLHHKLVLGGDQRIVVSNNAAWLYSLTSTFDYLNPNNPPTPLNPNNFSALTNPGPLLSNNFLAAVYRPDSKVRARISGVYLQDNISFWDDKITLMGGWRYNDFVQTAGLSFDTQSSTTVIPIVTNAGSTTPTLQVSNVQQLQAASTDVYRYGILFAPTNNYSAYYSHSEAFLFNDGRDYLNNPLLPSICENNEIGVKAQFFDGALAFSLTRFDLKVTNVRLTFVEGPNDPVPGKFSIKQSGFQTNKGFDFSVRASKAFNLGTLNFVATHYQGDIRTEIGIRPSRIPNTTNSIYGSFQLSRGALAGLKFGGGTNWMGDRVGASLFVGTNNGIQTRMPAYSTSNAFASYTWKRWRLQGNVDNVFDKVYIDGGESQNWITTNPGRTMRLIVGYAY